MTHSPATSWPGVAAVVLAGVAAAAQIGKVPAAMTTIAAELGLSLSVAALLVGLFSLLAGTGGLAIGLVAARLGARRVLLAGLMLGAGGAFAAAAAPGAAALLALRVAEGAGFVLVVVSAPTLIATLASGRERAFAMGLWGLFMPGGIAIGLLSAPLVEAFGWRLAWLCCAVLLAAATLACLWLVPPVAAASRATAAALPAQLRALAAARRPLLVALTFAAYNVTYFGIAAFLPAFLESRGAGTGAAGSAAALAAVANAAGNLGGALLMRRGIAPERLAMLGALAIALLAGALFLSPLAVGAVALAVVASAIGGLVPAACFAMLPGSVPQPGLVAPAAGLVIQANNLVVLLFPPLLGALAGVSWPLLALPLSGFGLLAAAIARVLAQGGARGGLPSAPGAP